MWGGWSPSDADHAVGNLLNHGIDVWVHCDDELSWRVEIQTHAKVVVDPTTLSGQWRYLPDFSLQKCHDIIDIIRFDMWDLEVIHVPYDHALFTVNDLVCHTGIISIDFKPPHLQFAEEEEPKQLRSFQCPIMGLNEFNIYTLLFSFVLRMWRICLCQCPEEGQPFGPFDEGEQDHPYRPA
jgi:hypothetical protein